MWQWCLRVAASKSVPHALHAAASADGTKCESARTRWMPTGAPDSDNDSAGGGTLKGEPRGRRGDGDDIPGV